MLRQELTCHSVGRWRPGQDPPLKRLYCQGTDGLINGRDRIEGPTEMPELQFVDEVVDISIVIRRRVPMLHTAQKTVQVPQLQYAD